jgi:hypothetical protein
MVKQVIKFNEQTCNPSFIVFISKNSREYEVNEPSTNTSTVTTSSFRFFFRQHIPLIATPSN